MPAGKVSFCVSAENARMGTYNGFEREEVEPGVFDNVFRDIGVQPPPLCTGTARLYVSACLKSHVTHGALSVTSWVL